MTPAFWSAKTEHELHRAAIVIGFMTQVSGSIQVLKNRVKVKAKLSLCLTASVV
jgi:hypothetical protein